jgi:hypothetical protein
MNTKGKVTMKNISRVASLALAIALLMAMTACGIFMKGNDNEQDKTPQEVTSTESGIVLSFPGSWSELELNDVASLEMGNEYQERYLAIIEEDLTDFADEITIEEYGDIVFENMQGIVEEPDAGEWADTTVGGDIPARQIVLNAVVENFKVSYLITVFKGDNTLYQALAWSLQSKYDEAVPVFDEILNSAKLPA